MKATKVSRTKAQPAPAPAPVSPTAIIYVRVSSREQGDSRLGLEAQQAFCRSICQSMGLEVLAVYEEVGTGAKHPMKRKEFMQAVVHANAMGAALVVTKLDRLSRNFGHAVQLLEGSLLPVTPKLMIAESPNATQLELRLRALIAAEERDLVSQRTKAALAAKKARDASFINGITGHEQHHARVSQNREEVLRRAAYLKRSGSTWSAVAERLNEMGYRTSTGTLWRGAYLGQLMRKYKPESRVLSK